MTKKANQEESKMTSAELHAKAEEMKSQLSALRKAARKAEKEEEAEKLRLERERADVEALEIGRKLRGMRLGRYTIDQVAAFDDERKNRFLDTIVEALDLRDETKKMSADGQNVYDIVMKRVNAKREREGAEAEQRAAEDDHNVADAQEQG